MATLLPLAELPAALLDLLLPGRCAACGTAARGVLCPACLGRCTPPAGPACLRCGAPWSRRRREAGCGRCTRFGRPFAFASATALWRYRGTPRLVVHAFKYHGRRDVLRPLGARLLRDPRCAAAVAHRPLVVAVPARRASRRRRGFDQARELAVGLARAGRLDFEPRALRRCKESGPQAGRSSARRRAQAAGAFRARALAVLDRPVLLVDDVLSTGATADSCARALLAAGASRVDVLALAT